MEKANYDGRKNTFHKGSEKYKNSPIPGKKNNTMSSKGHERWIEIDGIKIRNKRSVWTIPTFSYSDAHFATYPPALIEPCIKAGCLIDGIVLDPFMGSGTTGMVAKHLKRNYIGIELNKEYVEMAEKRIDGLPRGELTDWFYKNNEIMELK